MVEKFDTVLVTGGAGFIGSHLVQALMENHCRVRVLDNLSTGHLENLAAVRDKINFIEGDIRDLDTLSQVVQGCQAVFHMAAMVSVTQSVEQPLESAAVNDVGTLNVLETSRQHNVSRVVLASSSAVYGEDPTLPKIETMSPAPLSLYAVQKLTNEYYARLYYNLYGLETVCLRYFNVYGPRQDPSSPNSGVISTFMTRAAEGQAPTIYGEGQQTRDFVFVGDVVRANLLAAGSDRATGQVFNIGTGQSATINGLWKEIAQLAGCKAVPVYADPRSGDIMHSLSSIQKATKRIGFQPETDLSAGLRLAFEWYRQLG